MKPKVDTVLSEKQQVVDKEVKPIIEEDTKEINKEEVANLQASNLIDSKTNNAEDITSSFTKVELSSEEMEDIPFFDEEDSNLSIEDDYHKKWCKVVVDLTDKQPILAMCCSKAVEFSYDNNTLNVGFEYDTNMLLLEDEKNKQIISNELFNDNNVKLTFYLLDKPVDLSQEKVDRIKSLFDSKILKITKK